MKMTQSMAGAGAVKSHHGKKVVDRGTRLKRGEPGIERVKRHKKPKRAAKKA